MGGLGSGLSIAWCMVVGGGGYGTAVTVTGSCTCEEGAESIADTWD
jgi:hypothetical protein